MVKDFANCLLLGGKDTRFTWIMKPAKPGFWTEAIVHLDYVSMQQASTWIELRTPLYSVLLLFLSPAEVE
ncbi:hypothetical protein GDO81_013813 [Engystomops pustulosus]|uniref:Uncharacterized protein n=1 Tax=Engystomops pustulosus TaxID=76066 RepID=A0AAV7B5R4_ENGPU|nr:hypothetical protein GDO81_013813 [Engystomops pustulosus]